MRRFSILKWVWILGLILSTIALILSGSCKILNSKALAFCGEVIFKPTFGWVALVGLLLAVPLIVATRQDSPSNLDKMMAGMGFFLLVARAIYVAFPRVFLGGDLGDFSIYYAGMHLLYSGNNPYSVGGSVTFPLPAFFLYFLASLGGNLNAGQTYLVWWVINAVSASALIIISLHRMWDHSNSRIDVFVFTLFVLLSGIWDAMSHGQTTVLAALGVAIYMWCKFKKQRELELIGVLSLALAVMLKPYLGIGIAGGIGIGLVARRWRIIAQMSVTLIIIAISIGLSIMAPGGIDSRTYFEFWDSFQRLGSTTGLVTTAFNGGLYGNISPVSAIALMIGRLGIKQINDGWLSTTLGLVILIVISCILLLRFWQNHLNQDDRIDNYWVPYFYASVSLLKISYTHYTSWLIPTVDVSIRKSALIQMIGLLFFLALLDLDIGWIGALALAVLLGLSVNIALLPPFSRNT